MAPLGGLKTGAASGTGAARLRGRSFEDSDGERSPLIPRLSQSVEVEHPFSHHERQQQQQQQRKSRGHRASAGSGSPPPSSSYVTIAKVTGGVVVVLALLAGLKHVLSNPALIEAVLTGAKEHPGKVIPLFMLANLVAPLLLLPSGPFQLLAGAIWGLPLGFLISGSASLAANLIAFLIGRHLLQEKLSAYITANVPTFPAIQAAILAEGWSLVLMLRLSPVLPDSLMNYALSLTNISFKLFAAATATAMVPWTGMYLYLGSVSKDIVATLSGGGTSGDAGGDDEGSGGWANTVILVVSAMLSAAAVVYLGRVIKKAVAKAEEGLAAEGGTASTTG